MDAVKTSRGTILILAQNIMQYGAGLLFFAIAANILTKAELGLISTFTFISIIFLAIAPLSLNVAAARYIADFTGQNSREKASAVVRTVNRWVSYFSLSLLALGITVSYFFSSSTFISLNMLSLVLVYSFFLTIKSTYQSFLQGLQMFERYAVVGLISIALARVIGILFLIFGYGLIGVLISWVIGEAVGLSLAVIFNRNLLPSTRIYYDSRPLLAFSLPVLSMTVVNTASEWMDRVLLLTLTTNLETLGIYELVIRGGSTLSLIWVAINTTLLPTFSKHYGQSGNKDITRLTKQSLKYMGYLTFPASMGLAAISKSALALLFGWEYTSGNIALTILALFSVLTSFSTVVYMVLQAMGKTNPFLKITLITVITDVIFSALLIPAFNMNGAAVARAVMITVGFIYAFLELRKQVKIEIEGKAMLKTLIAAIVMAVPLAIFDTFYSGNIVKSTVLSVGIEIGAGIILYALTMLLLKTVSKQDFNLLLKMIPRPLSPILTKFERLFPS